MNIEELRRRHQERGAGYMLNIYQEKVLAKCYKMLNESGTAILVRGVVELVKCWKCGGSRWLDGTPCPNVGDDRRICGARTIYVPKVRTEGTEFIGRRTDPWEGE
jgi:hypothetical protein